MHKSIINGSRGHARLGVKRPAETDEIALLQLAAILQAEKASNAQ